MQTRRKIIPTETLKKWASTLKQNTYALYLASRDKRVPLLAKIVIGLVVAYALSPIDLIPDFIPLIGYLDDFILLPFGIWLSIRFIPREVWRECQIVAAKQIDDLPGNNRAAYVVVFIWLFALVCFILWLWPQINAITPTG